MSLCCLWVRCANQFSYCCGRKSSSNVLVSWYVFFVCDSVAPFHEAPRSIVLAENYMLHSFVTIFNHRSQKAVVYICHFIHFWIGLASCMASILKSRSDETRNMTRVFSLMFWFKTFDRTLHHICRRWSEDNDSLITSNSKVAELIRLHVLS